MIHNARKSNTVSCKKNKMYVLRTTREYFLFIKMLVLLRISKTFGK